MHETMDNFKITRRIVKGSIMGDISLPPIVEAREKSEKPGEKRQYAMLIRRPEELEAFLDHFKDALTKEQVDAIRKLKQPASRTKGTDQAIMVALEGPDSGNQKPVQVFEGIAQNVLGTRDGRPPQFMTDRTLKLNVSGKPLPQGTGNLIMIDVSEGIESIPSIKGAKHMFDHMKEANYGLLMPSGKTYAAADHKGDPLPPGFPGAGGGIYRG